MTNAEIAARFDELADLYELDGAIVHRVVAYRNAARSIRDAGVSVEQLARSGRAQELPAVGKTIAEKIIALLDTGTIPSADKLKQKFPPGLVDLTRIPGLGPKRARKVYDELGISSVEELREAAQTHRLRRVPGFGAKAEDNLAEILAEPIEDQPVAQTLLPRALETAEELVAWLRSHPAVERAEPAGSVRRLAETCKDIDLVCAATDARRVSEDFCRQPLVAEVRSGGESGARVVAYTGLRVDLRIVAPQSFGNLLQHLTGSKQHNEALRTDAVRRGLHVSEYGITDSTGRAHACHSEADVYRALGMDYIEPELRENRGELAAAASDELPKLVRLEDIRGDLHCHTIASDGRNTVDEMCAAARQRGYHYLAITDHSASHGFGNNVEADQLRRMIERVRALDAATDGITLLCGSEVNVLPDGSLDYDDELLGQLDWVIASLHSSFRLSERQMTDRVVSAIEHPLVDAIGHPTGRLIDRRNPYSLDIEQVIEAAARTQTLLEINGNPDRRDLHEVNARLAAQAGVKLVIDSDAHGVETLSNIRYGVATARRAWLGPADVANTLPWPELASRLKRSAVSP